MINAQGIEIEVLFNNVWFDVVSANLDGANMTGLDIHDAVVVLPFELDSAGAIQRLGIRMELNPLKGADLVKTAVTGAIDDEDESESAAAARELREESGFVIDEEERWYYLGKLSMHKCVKETVYCYAVDVTGKVQFEQPKGDGTVNEERSKFEMQKLSEALDTEDAYILSAYTKLLQRYLGDTFDID